MDTSSLLSIRKFSELTKIPMSTLRYYDRIGLFFPAEKGGDNKYRYYTPFQCITVNFVRVLVNLGVPLARIKSLAVERTPEDLLKLFMEQEQRLDTEMRELQQAYSVIHSFRNNIEKGIIADEDSISICYLEQTPTLLGDENDWKDKKNFYKPFVEFCNKAENLRMNLDYPIGGFFDDMEYFSEHPSRPNRFFSMDPSSNTYMKANYYLVAHKVGYYGVMGDCVKRIQSYARENGIALSGPVYVTYLTDEISELDRSKYISRVACTIDPDTLERCIRRLKKSGKLKDDWYIGEEPDKKLL